MKKIYIATCAQLPEPDPDAALLEAALRARGVVPELLAWDDPSQDQPHDAPTLLRSTWNYPLAPEAFLRWAEGRASKAPFWNDIEAVRWNLHKKYLLDLQREGFPIVPSVFVDRGPAPALSGLMDAQGWGRVVVKPAISAGSYRTRCVERAQAAEAQAGFAALCADADAMVQPYVASVDDYGERSLVWIDGQITHAVRKSPRFVGQQESVTQTTCPITPDEMALAREIFSFRAHLFFGRVDVVRLQPPHQPALAVMELELIEPSLFFKQSPQALAHFIQAITERLRR